MKKIIFVRHGKAEKYGEIDIKRELTKKGREEAKAIGKIIYNSIGKPGIILASPAERTAQTAEIIAQESKYKGEIGLIDSLYPGSIEEMTKIIDKIEDKIETIIIVGHNPAVEETVNFVIGYNSVLVEMSTAYAICFSAETKEWQDFYRNSLIKMDWAVDPKLLA